LPAPLIGNLYLLAVCSPLAGEASSISEKKNRQILGSLRGLRASIRKLGNKTISGGLLAFHDRMLLAQKGWISPSKSLPRCTNIHLIDLHRKEI
jgi:hypothetical protein